MTNADIRLFTEKKLFGRYINNTSIQPLLKKLPKSLFEVEIMGRSVLNNPIHSVTIGVGRHKILMWSQMHGNESATTKAIFDLFNVFKSDSAEVSTILNNCTICVIPILNPDGAEAYTRNNANNIDLNRDAKALSQPESVILKKLFNRFEPDYCFNLHGQRTIFGAGYKGQPASVSFLAPSQDQERSITETRKVAMSIIAGMNAVLQQDIPDGVGLYDDTFNDNCVGDMFQSLNVPTILFEAGHYPNDYNREFTRHLILKSLFSSCLQISKNETFKYSIDDYLDIPKNQKNFYDIIIKRVVLEEEDGVILDLAFQYKEILNEKRIVFKPCFVEKGDLTNYYAHHLIDGENAEASACNGRKLLKGEFYNELLLGGEKITLIHLD